MKRVMALSERFLTLSFREKFRIVDLFYYPIVNLLLWGLFARQKVYGAGGLSLIMISLQIIYSFAFQTQNNFNIFTMDDVWGDCFREIILIPVSQLEYIMSKLISATVRSILVFAILMGLSIQFFGFNPFSNEPLVFMAIALATFVAAIGIALVVDAFIVRFGRTFAFMMWSTTYLFLMLSCPWYPIDVMPVAIQPLVKVMPFYWIFSALKAYATGGNAMQFLPNAFLVALLYVALGIPVYSYVMKKSQKEGYLTRMG